MAKLITRLHGVRIVMSPIPSGVSPRPLWAGEYRTDDGHTLADQDGSGHWYEPAITGPTIGDVLRGLDHQSWWRRVTA